LSFFPACLIERLIKCEVREEGVRASAGRDVTHLNSSPKEIHMVNLGKKKGGEEEKK